MKKLLAVLAVCCALVGAATAAQATIIEYTQTGNTLNFTLFNDTSSVINSFDVSFGVTDDGMNFSNTAAFASVSDGTAPAGWTSVAFSPSALGLPWLYTAGADGAGLASGYLSGFSTTFTLAGTASADHLWFNTYDLDFNTIDSGYTTRHQDESSTVPEPGTFALLGAGLAGLVAWRRRQARQD